MLILTQISIAVAKSLRIINAFDLLAIPIRGNIAALFLMAPDDSQPKGATEIYRTLFHGLDNDESWTYGLGNDGAMRARAAVAHPDEWSRFLAGSDAPRSDPKGALRTLRAFARSPNPAHVAPVDTQDTTAARMRRRLALAAIDATALAHYSRPNAPYEQDAGLMRGDGGAASPSFDDLMRDEEERRRAHAPVFNLLGAAPSPPSRATSGASASGRAPRKRPRRASPDARFSSRAPTSPSDHELEALHSAVAGVLAAPALTPGAADYAAQTVDEIVGSALPPSPPDPGTPTESLDDADELALWPSDAERESLPLESDDELLLPVFANDTDQPLALAHTVGRDIGQGQTFADLLGEQNAVLKSVLSMRRIMALRKAVLEARDANGARNATSRYFSLPAGSGSAGVSAATGVPSTPVKSEPSLVANDFMGTKRSNAVPIAPQESPATDVPRAVEDVSGKASPLVIENEPTDVGSSCRMKAIAHAATALMLEQAGFTHTSTRAIDVLSDALGRMIRDIGLRLSSTRERVGESDREEPPGRAEMLLEATRVVTAHGGVRGGAAALQAYHNYDMRRIAVEQIHAENQLTQACAENGADAAAAIRAIEPPARNVLPAHVHGRVPDVFRSLNDAAWIFGYLPSGARLNVLGAAPTPPRSLGCSAIGCPEPVAVSQLSDATQDLSHMDTSS